MRLIIQGSIHNFPNLDDDKNKAKVGKLDLTKDKSFKINPDLKLVIPTIRGVYHA